MTVSTFVKAMLSQPGSQTTATFLVASAQSPWQKHWDLLDSPFSLSSRSSELSLLSASTTPVTQLDEFLLNFRSCSSSWDSGIRECLFLRQTGQCSGDKMMKCVKGKWTLKGDVILFFWALCSDAIEVSFPFDIFSQRISLPQRSSNCSSQTSSIHVTWELIRNADFQVPRQTYWTRGWFGVRPRNLCLESPPAGSDAHSSVRSSALSLGPAFSDHSSPPKPRPESGLHTHALS